MKSFKLLSKIAALAIFAAGPEIGGGLMAQSSQSAPTGNQGVGPSPTAPPRVEPQHDYQDPGEGNPSRLAGAFHPPRAASHGTKGSLAQRLVQDHLKQAAIKQPAAAAKRVDATQTNGALAPDLHPPAANKPGAGKEALMLNKSGALGKPVAPFPVGGVAAAPLTEVIRARGSNPAVIGGLTASSARHSAAVINGTAVNRKP